MPTCSIAAVLEITGKTYENTSLPKMEVEISSLTLCMVLPVSSILAVTVGYGEILASCCKVPVEGKNRRDCSKMVGQALVMIDLSV